MLTFSRLPWLLLIAACGLTAQNSESHSATHTIEGSHSAVWVGDGAPSNFTSAISLHGADIRFEGPPVKDAPYSAEAVTEVVQTLADGNRIRHESRTKIYRDSQGRTRREETLQPIGNWSEGPRDAAMIFIHDPVAGVHYILNPQQRTARKMPMPKIEALRGVSGKESGVATVTRTFKVVTEDGKTHEPAVKNRIIRASDGNETVALEGGGEQRQIVIERVSGPGAGDMLTGVAAGGEVEVEQLGERNIQGVLATGVRRTRTIKAGQIDNERPIEVVFEQWRSDELGVTVESRRSDPRSGVTTYKLENIQRTDPLPSLFEPPADYEIIEMPEFARSENVEIHKE